MEHLIKSAKYLKTMKHLILKDYQNEILKISPVPQKSEKKTIFVERISEELMKGINDEEKETNKGSFGKLNSKLLKIIKNKNSDI
jgi:hypothetical protein